jgi:hypothetical protein
LWVRRLRCQGIIVLGTTQITAINVCVDAPGKRIAAIECARVVIKALVDSVFALTHGVFIILSDAIVGGARVLIVAFDIGDGCVHVQGARDAPLDRCVAAFSVKTDWEFTGVALIAVVVACARDIRLFDVGCVGEIGLRYVGGDVSFITDFGNVRSHRVVDLKAAIRNHFGDILDVRGSFIIGEDFASTRFPTCTDKHRREGHHDHEPCTERDGQDLYEDATVWHSRFHELNLTTVLQLPFII